MDENKARILNMLKDGQITVQEADELLSALETPAADAAEPLALKDSRGRKGKKLRVIVDTNDHSQNAKAKVNVSVPVSLIKTLGPVIAKNLPADAKAEIDKAGVDLVGIMESIDALIEAGQEEDIVNVDIDGPELSKVRVYVE